MKKNRGENFSSVEVDTVTGEYVIKVPEWIISEFGWYEGTEINMEVDGDAIVVTELDQWTYYGSHSIITIECIHISS